MKNNYDQAINNFLDGIFNTGFEAGKIAEHQVKRKTCKYFKHQGGVLFADYCTKLNNNCAVHGETCPSNDEPLISVRKS